MYEMMPLPYPYNALEPDIIEEIVRLHYNAHYKNYYDGLMEALRKENYDFRYPLEELPSHIDEFSLSSRPVILFNAGGVLNHNLYWLSTGRNSSEPTGTLLNQINKQYGSFENFKRLFTDQARYLVGSGYTFLVSNEVGNLQIINMPNQETPYTYNLIPLFTIDLWEHAYYLQYKSDRKGYIEHFWNKANFDYASYIYTRTFG